MCICRRLSPFPFSSFTHTPIDSEISLSIQFSRMFLFSSIHFQRFYRLDARSYQFGELIYISIYRTQIYLLSSKSIYLFDPMCTGTRQIFSFCSSHARSTFSLTNFQITHGRKYICKPTDANLSIYRAGSHIFKSSADAESTYANMSG